MDKGESMYRGKRLNDMTKEELIEIIHRMNQELNRTNEEMLKRLKLWTQ